MRTKLVFCSLLVSLATLLILAEEKKLQPESSKPVPRAQIPVWLGYDIAVFDIGTTGPPQYIPVITFQNKGKRMIRQDLAWNYKTNGIQVFSGFTLDVDLAPQQTYIWTGQPTSSNFAKPGDVIEVSVDLNNQLTEDDEVNNTMTKTIPVLTSHPLPVKRNIVKKP